MKALTKVGLAAVLVTTVCATNISLATASASSINPAAASLNVLGKHHQAGKISGSVDLGNPVFDESVAGGCIGFCWWD